MRVVKYCVALWVLVVVYTTVSLFAGERGISAYNELLEELARQETNMKDLKRINMELENTKNALLYDSDTIRVYARDLGFGEENEKFVRIVGLGQNRKVPLFPGEVVIPEERQYMDNKTICLISIFAALTVFIAFLVQDILDLNLNQERRAPFLDPAGVAGRSVPLKTFRRTPQAFPPEPPFTS
ncbi:MAG: septum formation initiator family protein [Treponema sp.]|jgi:cell division protein FtsB|nr:septum formation initiator family protein [Treponema sp.]